MSTKPSEFKQVLHGVWPAIPTPWNVDGTVDQGLVTELVNRYQAAGVDGAYTTGTDGEMHVMEREDLAALTDAFAGAAAAVNLPIQIGCTWSHTEGVIARARDAADRGVQCIQVALPSWISLSNIEMLNFFGALQQALPDIAFVHYNIAKSGRFLTGADYVAIQKVAPNLIGSKHTGGDIASLIEITEATPDMHHFVVDTQIVPGALFGSPGFYSFLANLNPHYAVALWSDCQQGHWEEAAQKRRIIDRFFRDWRETFGTITASSAMAKIATKAGILAEMSLAVRAPYQAGTDEHVAALQRLLNERYPELIYRS